MPPGHAVGAWLAAGALGHAWPPSARTSPVSPLSERPQPCPRPFRRALPHSCSLFSAQLFSRRARSWPAPPFAHRPLQGLLHGARRCWALGVNPGALDARCAGRAEGPKVRAGSPRAGTNELAPALSLSRAFAEPWPRWACRPLRARAGAGAGAAKDPARYGIYLSNT